MTLYYLKFYNPLRESYEPYEYNIEPVPAPDGLCLAETDRYVIEFVEGEEAPRNLVPLMLWRDRDLTSLVKDWGDQTEAKFQALRKAYRCAQEKIVRLEEITL